MHLKAIFIALVAASAAIAAPTTDAGLEDRQLNPDCEGACRLGAQNFEAFCFRFRGRVQILCLAAAKGLGSSPSQFVCQGLCEALG